MQVESLNRLIQDLYGAVLDCPAEGFIDWAFQLTRRQVAFDSGMWVMAAIQKPSAPYALHLYRQPAAMMENYARYAHQDYVIGYTFDAPGRTVDPLNYLSRREIERTEAYNEHSRHFGIEQVFATLLPQPALKLGSVVSLYRDDKHRPFPQEDRRFVELLTPHFVEAVRLNQVARLLDEAPSADREGCVHALCDSRGMLHHTEPGFARILTREWPGWSGPLLPDPVLPLLDNPEKGNYEGERIVLKVEPFQALRKVSVRERRAADALSPREYAVAGLLAKGLSYQAVARVLGISPSTVTNHANRIYSKLGVRSKTELASEIGQ